MKFRFLSAVAAVAALGACNFVQGGGSGSGGGGGGNAQAVAPAVDAEQLRAAVTDERVRRFYEARQWQPAWNEAAAGELMAAITEDAPRHALAREQLLPAGAERAEPAAREAAMSLAAINFAEALARGRTDPARIFEVYTHQRPEADAVAGLNQAVQQGGVRQWLATLAPQDPEYRALSEAYMGYRNRAAREGPRAIPVGEAIEPGGNDPRVATIAEALRENGYLAAAAPAQPQQQQGQAEPKQKQRQQAAPATRYTPELVAAVRRLQGDYGINPDGIIGETTVQALNTGAFGRARTLAVNLERRRWLAREAVPTRIDVNTAAAELYYFRDGNLANRRRVVVGQQGNETPELSSPMFRLVANPTWTVPRSIEEEEIAPRGAAYLRANNMTRGANGFIIQQPGPRNSLGLVKFDMQNEHAIYLHDTPAKGLFAQNERHASHGCVRVQDALGFARMIAEHEGVLPQYQQAQATGEETMVPLPRRLPVRLLYHSAFVDNGRVVFRPDPYGWDDRVAEALGLARRERPQVTRHVGDVGP